MGVDGSHGATGKLVAPVAGPKFIIGPSTMKMRETVLIHATPEAIWPYVANPVLMSAWNPKIVSVNRMSEEPVRLGEQYVAIYAMGGKEREARVEVVACEPAGMLTLRHRTADAPQGHVDVTYILRAKGTGTQVEERIDMGSSGLPWIMRALMWFIQRFGTPAGEGKPYLERLKDAAEGVAEGSKRQARPGASGDADPQRTAAGD